MFICDKCGLCCKQIGNSQIYNELNRGDGACKFLDDETKLCTIYQSRPLLCNVDKTYEIVFKEKMSKDEYYKLNYEACKKIKEKHGRVWHVPSRVK